MVDTPKTATCACGAAVISVQGDPLMHMVCHCTNCKRRTGSAFGVSVYFAPAQLVKISGELQVYKLHNAEQNHEQKRHFCAVCGTTMYWLISTRPDLVGIAGGCFPEGAVGEPTSSGTHQKKWPWVSLPEDWECH